MILFNATCDMADIASAFIAFLGVLITAIFTVKSVNREIYNKSVTLERIKWLNKVREDYSIIMAAYETYNAGNRNNNEPRIEKNEYDRRMYEAEKAKYDLISRLNTSTFYGNEYNGVLKDTLMKMSFIKDSGKKNEEIKEFMIYMNLMLEQEWQKSKKESK